MLYYDQRWHEFVFIKKKDALAHKEFRVTDFICEYCNKIIKMF